MFKKDDILKRNLLPVEKYFPRILKKQNIFTRLQKLWLEAHVEELEVIFEELSKKLGFAAAYRDLPIFKNYAEVDSLASKKKYGKTIIVDRFSFYVPYHVDPVNFGIYFRAKRIENDFRKFAHFVYYLLKNRELLFLRDEYPSRWVHFRSLVNRPKEFIVSLFVAYISHLYFHALTHHIIEDISMYLELIKKGKYSPVRSIDEEKFAEWVAFKTMESYKVPEVLYQSRKAERLINMFSYMLPPADPEKIVDVTFAIPTLLYVHFNSHEATIFSPEVTKEVSQCFSIIWEVMKHLHFTLETDPLELPEGYTVFTRIFLTRY